MDAHLDCGPCVLRQAIDATRQTDADERTEKRVLRQVAGEVSEMDFDDTPMTLASQAQQVVQTKTGVADPFEEVKAVSNDEVLELYPAFEEDLRQAEDRLATAVRLAIAGNVIDVGPGHDIDIEATVGEVLDQSFAIDDLASLRADLAEATDVLYLADNAGEIVLDRLLIEQLDADVEVVVKDQPFLNDVTAADARAAGIDEVADLRTRGSDGVGTVTPAFERRLREADVVISKGQGNYELFSDADPSIYFLFMVKCSVVADDVGAPEGSIVLTQL
jgi:hypothetical protein